MEKHYLFKCSYEFDQQAFFMVLSDAGIDTRTIVFSSPTQGEFIADSSFYSELYQILKPFHDDIGGTMSILIAHNNGPFEQKLLNSAIAYFPNSAVFPSQVILREFSYNNYDSYGPLMDLFRPISSNFDLMETASSYLATGLDASAAAKALFIHRNTFNYRLAQFIQKTGVDIRDYHNALLFELYLSFKRHH